MNVKGKVTLLGSIIATGSVPIATISCGNDNKEVDFLKGKANEKLVHWEVQDKDGNKVSGTGNCLNERTANFELEESLLKDVVPVRVSRDINSIYHDGILSGVHEIDETKLEVGYIKRDGSVMTSKSEYQKYLSDLFREEHYAYGTEFLSYTQSGMPLPYRSSPKWRYENRILAYIHDHPSLKDSFISDIRNDLYPTEEKLKEGIEGFVGKYDEFISKPLHPFVDKNGQMYIDEAEIVMTALNTNGSLPYGEYTTIDGELKYYTLREVLISKLGDVEYKGHTYSGYNRLKSAIFSDMGITVSPDLYYRYICPHFNPYSSHMSIDINDFKDKHSVGSIGYEENSDDILLNNDPVIVNHTNTYAREGYVFLTKNKDIALKYLSGGNLQKKVIGYHGPSIFDEGWEWLTVEPNFEDPMHHPATLTRDEILIAQDDRDWNSFLFPQSYISRLLRTRTFDFSPNFDPNHPHWDLLPTLKFIDPNGDVKYFQIDEENYRNIGMRYDYYKTHHSNPWWIQFNVDSSKILNYLKGLYQYNVVRIEK